MACLADFRQLLKRKQLLPDTLELVLRHILHQPDYVKHVPFPVAALLPILPTL